MPTATSYLGNLSKRGIRRVSKLYFVYGCAADVFKVETRKIKSVGAKWATLEKESPADFRSTRQEISRIDTPDGGCFTTLARAKEAARKAARESKEIQTPDTITAEHVKD